MVQWNPLIYDPLPNQSKAVLKEGWSLVGGFGYFNALD